MLESKRGLGRPHRVKKNQKKLNGPAHCCSSRGGHRPCTACNDLRTCRALPDADRLALHSVLKKKRERARQQNPHSPMPEAFACLAAERAGVPCVLGNFHLEGRDVQVKSAFLFRGGRGGTCAPACEAGFSSHLFNLLAQGSTVALTRCVSLGLLSRLLGM